jgi:hypothetical protein
MELNKHDHSLPEWPPIRFDKSKNEYSVGGPHLTLGRYRMCRLLFFPAPVFLGERFWPVQTVVRFTPQHIFVGGKRYDNAPEIPVQFRANRPTLKEGWYYRETLEKQRENRCPEGLAFELKFRELEMIYGSRLVKITEIADEDRAAQFAIALQHGCDLSRAQLAVSPRPTTGQPSQTADHLPE